jgi:hypothetical protein
MKITAQKNSTKTLNLIIGIIFSICVALTSLAGFLNTNIALLSIGILAISSILMFRCYKLEKWKLGSGFYILNLLGLMVLPIVRITGTSFREGYVEILVITIPLIALIVWNEKAIKN